MPDPIGPRLRRIFRDWYITIIGVALVLGGTVFAAQFAGQEPTQEAAITSPSGETDAAPAAQTAAAPDSPEAPGRAATSEPQPAQTAETPPPAPAQPDAQRTQDQPPPAGNAPAAEQPAPQQAAEAPDSAHQHMQHAAPQAVANNASQTAQAPAQPAAPAAPAQSPAAAPQPAAAGGTDTRAGQLAFRKCQACHSLDAGKNLIGPSLSGVVGKPAGQVAGFNYSPAMKDSGVTWTPENLSAFLEAPQKFIPKNKMAFPGLKLASERTDLIAYLQASSGQQPAPAAQPAPPADGAQTAAPPAAAPPPVSAARATPPATQQQPPAVGDQPGAAGYVPSMRYTLRSGIAEGRMVYLGVGGAIDGQVNPILSAAEGQVVQVTLLNGEGAEHDVVFPEMNAASPRIVGRGTSTVIVFRATRAGDFTYYCSVAGHREAGMEGQFIVTPRLPEDVAAEADIAQLPTEVPAPIGDRDPETLRVDLVAVELEARLADGTTYGFWTFNGRVPGPMLRARVGDTLDVHVKNAEDSAFIHSVDFHAATGPGGGAVSTQVDPGHTKSFKFKALVPGLYVYHCATPMVAHHITNGMYGMILVEPEGGLAPVDREFYVMQGEIYTQDDFGQHGRQEFSVEKLLDEEPEYFVFNGSVGALSKLHPLKAKVGETVRIYFGVGGPNFTSSFHVIGEIFDRVYAFADLQSPPLQGVQTITVPPGGATVVEFKVDVPGDYVLVDHALSRAERGLVGILQVEGNPNPEIYDGKIEEGSGH